MDPPPTLSRLDWRLRRARDFIYSAYRQRLDLRTISKHAELSPFHFLRSFRKLGLEIRTDSKMGDFRWVTVGPKDQPEMEIVLLPIVPGPMLDAAAAKQFRELVGKGVICPGVFGTDDVRADYEELKKKGVEFKSPPTERHYGIEAVFQDDSGNWFSLTQRKK